jgi:hypothetical protein
MLRRNSPHATQVTLWRTQNQETEWHPCTFRRRKEGAEAGRDPPPDLKAMVDNKRQQQDLYKRAVAMAGGRRRRRRRRPGNEGGFPRRTLNSSPRIFWGR